MDREEPPAVGEPGLFRGSRGHGHDRGRKAREIGLVVDDHLEGVCLGEDVLAELDRQRRQLLVELAEAGLAGGIEERAAADEVLVGVLEEEKLLAVELELVALVVDGLHAGEELLVEADVVAVGGQHRRGLAGQGLELVVRVGPLEGAEDGVDLGQEDPGAVERGDRIFEGRLLAVRDDGVDLGRLEADPLLDGRQKVLVLDQVERRDVERRAVRLEEGIIGVGGGRGGGFGRERGSRGGA